MGIVHRSATRDLLTAVYGRLNSTEMTTLATSGVFNHVPQGTVPPYVVIGNPTEVDGWTTPGEPGKSCTVQVRAVSYAYGDSQPLQILDKAIALLMRGFGGSTEVRLTVSNHHVGDASYESGETYTEEVAPGVVARHAVGLFRFELVQST
jgi:hypothetical protein